jgi:hypothetical protein
VSNPSLAEQLPPRVNVVRLLTWAQFYLTLLNLLVVLVAIGIVYSQHAASSRSDKAVALVALAATAIVLAITAGLMRRRWRVVPPLLILGQLAVVTDVYLGLRAGLVVGSFTVLTVIAAGLIVTQLFRPGVWRYFYGRLR